MKRRRSRRRLLSVGMRALLALAATLRRDGELVPASWEEALAAAAARLEAHKGNAVGMFSCSKGTNEMNFLAQKFGRVALGTNNIESCHRT